MAKILEYIMLNYTWFLGGAILILLAIIGSYADKTNFGQGEKKLDKDLDLDKDIIVTDEDIENEKEVIEGIPEVEDVLIEKEENNESTFEENFDKLSNEFEELLPKKELIDNELLEDIENLSLDKTQKIDLSVIPDLDDVDLPEIKKLAPEEHDVWKF